MSVRRIAATSGVLVAASCLTILPTTPAVASAADLVISEVYGGGGNSGATLTHDFVELRNPMAAPVSVAGLSVQYRPASPSSGTQTQVTVLDGTVPAGGHYLVQLARGSGGTDPLPTPDATGAANMSGTGGQAYLVDGTAAVTPPTGDVTGDDRIIDFVGYGTSTKSYETAPTASTSNDTSAQRQGADTDHNANDFVIAAPDPQASGGTGEPPQEDPVELSIAEIQGTGPASPYDGEEVVTRGVVTAAYPDGGVRGFHVQTPGTGATGEAASHGVFVFGSAAARQVGIGDHVEVTGEVDEFFGLTEIVADGVEVLDEPAAPVVPLRTEWPGTDAERERLEGMLLAPQGEFTVTDNWSLNQYGEIGIAQGTRPLRQPTDVAPHGSDEAAAVAAHNAAARVTLDDGATTNFLGGDRNKDIPLPWLTDDPTIRVGEPVRFRQPVVLDYRFSLWRFQPVAQLTAGDDNGVLPATFGDTRTPQPRDVGGDLQVATFNVLNYFTTLGDELDGCTYYDDRDGDPVTVRGGCLARGAAEDEDFQRQQSKIVAAINALGAEVVSLEEIENGALLGADRDEALASLVDALNAEAGEGTWAYVKSPAEVPAPEREDVIRNAFIYRPAAVRPLGPSLVYDGPEFDNARDPLAQVFMPVGGSDHDTFLLVVNHFKSKGSAPSNPDDPNADHGQGAWNALRTEQARALAEFADRVSAEKDVEKVYLGGDLNSYLHEDPLRVLYDAGYTSLQERHGTSSTYLFGGLVGSLDHWLANDAALGTTTGADVWNVNSVESVALEYSRHNYNATDFFDATTPFRSSDHDPIVFGVDVRRNPRR